MYVCCQSVRNMKLLLISLIGLSVCAAHSHDLCSAQQAAIIQQQWSAAFTEDIKLSQFARAFFTKYVTFMSVTECT